MFRDTEGWIEEYKKRGALWFHDGNSKRPHALLTSGKHSNGFFNSRIVISDEPLLREAASDLVEMYGRVDGFLEDVRLVVGPQTGATKLAEFISDDGKKYLWLSNWVSPAKSGGGQDKRMVFDNYERFILRDTNVLLCEDVITTGESVELTAKAVIEAGGIIFPFVLALVNRSGLKEVDGRKIIALVDHPMPIWKPDECPLCKEGSKPLRPKDNWELLNAEY